MKLKYYLRGIGIGVIVATLILAVSNVIHNNNLSDEFIIKEAQKLGMIMPENTENNDSLWSSNTEDDSQEDSETSEDMQTEEESQTTQGSQISEDAQSFGETQNLLEKPTAVIMISDIDGAGSVARKLYSLGIVDSEDDFHEYLRINGYSTRIRSGRFEIPKDATYDEICNIIIN